MLSWVCHYADVIILGVVLNLIVLSIDKISVCFISTNLCMSNNIFFWTNTTDSHNNEIGRRVGKIAFGEMTIGE